MTLTTRKNAIRIKNWKFTGIYAVNEKLLKGGTGVVVEILTKLYSKVWIQIKIPRYNTTERE